MEYDPSARFIPCGDHLYEPSLPSNPRETYSSGFLRILGADIMAPSHAVITSASSSSGCLRCTLLCALTLYIDSPFFALHNCIAKIENRQYERAPHICGKHHPYTTITQFDVLYMSDASSRAQPRAKQTENTAYFRSSKYIFAKATTKAFSKPR